MKKLLFITLVLFAFFSSSVFAQQELIAQRTYNQKVYDLGNGKKNYKIHTAQIHYKDGVDFKDIDTTLSFDNTKKVFHQEKASYHCNIPEYSDDWFEFYNAYEGANHTIKAKPVAEHIKGEYFKGDDGQGVIYKDAFGKGIDLKVYAYWHGLKKVIIVNEKPAEIKDMVFDFELGLPVNAMVKDRQGTEWDKSNRLDFKDKVLKIGEQGKESYFNPALMWDSAGNIEKVDIELFIQDGKTYLRKTIPKDFLENATYPVYTDHPTNYNPTAGDGYIKYEISSNWNTTHDATSGTTTDYTGALGAVASVYGGVFTIARGYFPINTSGIDDSHTVTAALLYVYNVANADTDDDGDDWINVVQTSQASTTTLANADYDQCGAINNPTEGATRIDITGWVAGYHAWTLNSTGRGWIDKTGISKLGLREGHDAIDSPISAISKQVNSNFATSEDTSGTKDPYLSVTAAAPSTYLPSRSIGMGIGVGIGVN